SQFSRKAQAPGKPPPHSPLQMTTYAAEPRIAGLTGPPTRYIQPHTPIRSASIALGDRIYQLLAPPVANVQQEFWLSWCAAYLQRTELGRKRPPPSSPVRNLCAFGSYFCRTPANRG